MQILCNQLKGGAILPFFKLIKLNKMKILKMRDGFLWGDVTEIAKDIFNAGTFELYAVYFDGSESLLTDIDAINNQIESGLPICIELDNEKIFNIPAGNNRISHKNNFTFI